MAIVRARLTWLALAVAATLGVLANLYLLLAQRSSGPTPRPKTYRIVLREGRLVSSPVVLESLEGDSITLMVTCDKAATLEVHEYEQQFVVSLVPNEEATATFTALRAGRFPVHVIGIDPSHPDVEVAAIQVHPR